MRIIHHNQCIVALGQIADPFERSERAIHGKDAIGDNQACSSAFCFMQFCLKIVQVPIGVAQSLGLAQANAIDDRGVIERIGEHRVFFRQQGFKKPPIRIETRGVENCVIHAEKCRQFLLQRSMYLVRAADEAHRGHAVAVLIKRTMCRLEHRRVIGQSKVVVGAQIEHFSVAHLNQGALCRTELPFGLEQALFAQLP